MFVVTTTIENFIFFYRVANWYYFHIFFQGESGRPGQRGIPGARGPPGDIGLAGIDGKDGERVSMIIFMLRAYFFWIFTFRQIWFEYYITTSTINWNA